MVGSGHVVGRQCFPRRTEDIFGNQVGSSSQSASFRVRTARVEAPTASSIPDLATNQRDTKPLRFRPSLGCLKVIDILERCPRKEHAWPMGWFLREPLPHGRDFLRYAKFGTLQYSVIKPATALVALILAPVGLYKEVGPSVPWLQARLCG